MKPVRWGILSTARIGTRKVIPGMRKSALLDDACWNMRVIDALFASEKIGRLEQP